MLALKGNQGTLRDDVEEVFTEQNANKFSDCKPSCHETLEKSHGRIETRTVTVVGDVDWLTERHAWEGLASIAMVESCREIGAKTECESRFYITSLSADAERLSSAIRGHRGVEKGLHWVMDMVFRVMPEARFQNDECRIRKDNAPANFTTVKHMASNLLRQTPGTDSLRVKRKVAVWNDDYIAEIIAPR